MRIHPSLLTLVLALGLPPAPAGAAPRPVPSARPPSAASLDCARYWKRLQELHDRYEDKHDPAAGRELLHLLPTGKRRAPEGCSERDVAMTTLERDPSYRAERLKLGDPLAFELSFRLMNIADGAYAESLDQDLGASIRPHPALFLKSLRAEHGEAFCDEGLVGNTGDYSDDRTDELAELAARDKALSGVADKGLARVRDACLATLRHLRAEEASHAEVEKPLPVATPSASASPPPPPSATPVPFTDLPPASPPSGPEDGSE